MKITLLVLAAAATLSACTTSNTWSTYDPVACEAATTDQQRYGMYRGRVGAGPCFKSMVSDNLTANGFYRGVPGYTRETTFVDHDGTLKTVLISNDAVLAVKPYN